MTTSQKVSLAIVFGAVVFLLMAARSAGAYRGVRHRVSPHVGHRSAVRHRVHKERREAERERPVTRRTAILHLALRLGALFLPGPDDPSVSDSREPGLACDTGISDSSTCAVPKAVDRLVRVPDV